MSITIIFDRSLGIMNNFQGDLVVAEYTRVLDLPNFGNNLTTNEFKMLVYTECLHVHQDKQRRTRRRNSKSEFRGDFSIKI